MSNGVDVDRETNTIFGYRKLRESGDSLVVTIPREVVAAAGLDVDEFVSISANMDDNQVIIRPDDRD